MPEVQYIGSTSSCGCDFPFLSYLNGTWSLYEHDERDPSIKARDRYNREALVSLLRNAGETAVELYGVWEGDFEEEPKARESIKLEDILEPGFRIKEQVFYKVWIGPAKKPMPNDRSLG